MLGAALLYFGLSFVSPVALVAAPLVPLLLAQGPGRRERMVALLALVLVAWSAAGGSSEFARFEAAWVLVLGGACAIVMLFRPPAEHDLTGTGLLVVGFAAATGALLIALTDFSWGQLRWAAERHFGWQMTRVLGVLFAMAGGGAELQMLDGLRASVHATVRAISLLLPGLVLIQSLAALAAAWALYRLVAREPVGTPLPALRQFRFSDHLIWGVIVATLALVLPGLDSLRVAGGNLAAFFGGLYLARGLAVVAALASAAGLGGPLAVMAGVLATIFLLPLVGLAALALGVSDTWVDWRTLASRFTKR
jgi:hypothetical protein